RPGGGAAAGRAAGRERAARPGVRPGGRIAMTGRGDRRSRSGRADPFGALGLPPDRGLTDDDVRAAWRRIATATHPDRADGGDPAQFAAAARAYSDLRTRFGRNEAL